MTATACTSRPCLSRRTALAAGGASLTLALAACGDGSEAPATGDPEAQPEELANIADIPVGGALVVSSAASGDLLLTQPSEGEIHAFSAVCTHQGCAVEPGEGELSCPCHGSAFDLATGDVLRGPANEALPEVSIEVDEAGAVVG
ncbi:Rieske (2Fe-2S) protein [Pseudactinotalea sp.]|uniref:Rieske (2Fe-2S) protein n=1 Tax=Pseudactinotalea sp. TaxID=1926260 RepID=UPI003B3AE26A